MPSELVFCESVTEKTFVLLHSLCSLHCKLPKGHVIQVVRLSRSRQIRSELKPLCGLNHIWKNQLPEIQFRYILNMQKSDLGWQSEQGYRAFFHLLGTSLIYLLQFIKTSWMINCHAFFSIWDLQFLIAHHIANAGNISKNSVIFIAPLQFWGLDLAAEPGNVLTITWCWSHLESRLLCCGEQFAKYIAYPVWESERRSLNRFLCAGSQRKHTQTHTHTPGWRSVFWSEPRGSLSRHYPPRSMGSPSKYVKV